MSNQKTLILIDGHALAFRQYYALERTGMRTSSGVQTWAVYGFFKAIFDLLKNEEIKPDSIAVTFDVGRQTFRVEKYNLYKANREDMPDSLRSQLGLIVEGLNAFNIPIYTKEGFEADDVIGTITAKAAKLGHKTYILTGDQDSFQLVDRESLTTVLIPSKGELLKYDWYKVHEKLGIWPNQVIDYKALRGDSSDNIPGVKGIGEKIAQKLLTRYSCLEDIYADVENIPEKAVRNRLIDGQEFAFLSKDLATIVRDVDIDFNFEDTKVELPKISEVMTYLKKMQFYTFVKNIDKILCIFDKNCDKSKFEDIFDREESIVEFKSNTPTQTQLGLFSTAAKEVLETKTYSKKFVETKEDIEKLVTILSKQSKFSFDFVSDYNNATDINILGCAFGVSDNEKDIETFYVKNTDDNFEKFRSIFENNHIKKYTYNSKLGINILKNLNIDIKNVSFDVFLASYIKNPSRSHDLSAQALDYVNHISEELPLDNKKTKLATLSQTELGTFAMDNAFVIYLLSEYWLKNLTPSELRLHDNLELPLSSVLAKMEYDGVAIDIDYMSELSEHMSEEISKLEVKIFDIAGEKFNINSPKQVGEILYNKLGIELKKKRGNKKKLSTGSEVLAELAEEHDICKYLIEYRKYAKLKSTYTDSLPLLVSLKDFRIHTTYNQATTATGRLSSSNPNLQNIPIRTEEGNKLRKAFVPEVEGNYILSSDYSQIELRLLAHISGDENLIEAFNSGTDIHSMTASKVFDVPLEEVTKEMRYKAKAVNFGIIYGQSKYGLAKALKIAPFAAEAFIEKYFETYPKVKTYMKTIVDMAYKNGYVETIFGRKRYLSNELASPNRMLKEFAERAAINHPMQGTAADLIKMAMINISKKFKEQQLKSKMVIQVHDELVFEVEKDELDIVKALVTSEMQNVEKMRVPLLVDVNWGSSWKEV